MTDALKKQMARWATMPPTDKQVATLRLLKCQTGYETKLDAALAIGNARNKPATEKQKAFLKRKGYANWATATTADVGKFFGELNKKKQQKQLV